ncbi:MAG: ABC transporter permease [Bacteroidales bacterium]|nr:ABC transporter permease [Bacteroidales bacterium]
MKIILKLIKESYIFAIQQLLVNKLRTLLSLLGITIGIFAVITVLTVVDSLHIKISESINSLGDNVLYVQKWPWEFNNDFPWWKYFQRPVPDINDMNELQNRSNGAANVVFMVSAQIPIEHEGKQMTNVSILGVSNDYDKIFSFDLSEGRYFTVNEGISGSSVIIIGHEIATNLFKNENPIGKKLKIRGVNMTVIGIFKKEGSDIFNESRDNQLLIPINQARKLVNIRSDRYNPMIIVKAKEGVSNDELRDEITGIMRSVRRLKPKSDDNFSINEITNLTKNFDGIFATLNIAGWFIGGLSLLVGGFGIANIMFVSVRERTKLIGIQKSLGAKNYFILFQFLFESIFLSLIGGVIGLLLVFGVVLIANEMIDFKIVLTIKNILTGISVSVFIGIVAGLIPAILASRLNPVEAIRTN